MKTGMIAILFSTLIGVQTLRADDQKKVDPAEPEKQPATQPVTQPAADTQPANAPQAVCLVVTRRIPSAASPLSAPRVVTELSTALKLGTSIITDLDNVRGIVSAQFRSPDGTILSPAKLVATGWDTGLALLQAEGPAATFTPDFATVEIDSDLTLTSCGKNSVELYRLRVDSLYDDTLENNEAGLFRLIGVSATTTIGKAESGAPVFAIKRLAGLYHSGRRTYVIPTKYILRFIADASNGDYRGIPRRGFYFQQLVQKDLRRYLSLPESFQGVRITRVFGDSLLLPGDFLKEMDGKPIGNDGLVKAEPTVTIDDFLAKHQAGKINVTVNRAGTDLVLGMVLSPLPDEGMLVRSSADRRTFFYGAGLVFQALDYDLMHDSRAATDPQLKYRYATRYEDRLNEEADRDIILTNVYADSVNLGAEDFLFAPVESINGTPVRNLDDLKKVWSSSTNEFFLLRFRNRPGALAVPRESIKTAETRIRIKYNLPDSALSESVR